MGAAPLHHALAACLNRVRGTSARPENILVCNGYAQGVGLNGCGLAGWSPAGLVDDIAEGVEILAEAIADVRLQAALPMSTTAGRAAVAIA